MIRKNEAYSRIHFLSISQQAHFAPLQFKKKNENGSCFLRSIRRNRCINALHTKIILCNSILASFIDSCCLFPLLFLLVYLFAGLIWCVRFDVEVFSAYITLFSSELLAYFHTACILGRKREIDFSLFADCVLLLFTFLLYLFACLYVAFGLP